MTEAISGSSYACGMGLYVGELNDEGRSGH